MVPLCLEAELCENDCLCGWKGCVPALASG